jgi:hypothetical protein
VSDHFASTERVVKFTDGKVITHILGCHIEQSSTPYLDYPVGTMYQPHEHELSLSRGHLIELNEGLKKLHGVPARVAYRDFTIWPAPTWDELDAMEKENWAKQKAKQWDQLR